MKVIEWLECRVKMDAKAKKKVKEVDAQERQGCVESSK